MFSLIVAYPPMVPKMHRRLTINGSRLLTEKDIILKWISHDNSKESAFDKLIQLYHASLEENLLWTIQLYAYTFCR